MFSLTGRGARMCDGVTRRELIRVGGLSMLGLSLPQLLHARDNLPEGVPPTDKTFGRAKNVIYLWLAGGPPQHETFDPKPEAPVEVRGPFKPISTNVPGIQFCELLPRTARIADKLAIVRSMATDDNNHDGSGYWVWTGYKYQGPNSRTIQPTDWPYFGSIVKLLKPSDVLPPLSTVWLPDMARLNENVTQAGQTGGFLGRQWDPDRFLGDPSKPDYKVEGLQLTDIPALRLARRQSLLAQVDKHFGALERGKDVRIFDQFQNQAFSLLTSGKAREAFAIEKEPDKIRDRYGRHSWGQCVLLARRLIEAGVRLVHVQWPREPGDNAVDNPLWDTHNQNADRLEDVLCPKFDVTFTALIEDLDQRGLLDETLVVAIGEFGRTPAINASGGRDHWGPVFSFAMAGAGISGGQVYGASDKNGAYPSRDRVQGENLTASIFHLLGINYQSKFVDAEGRKHRITLGEPIFKLLGTDPATLNRCPAGGDVARVPPYNDQHLLNADFEAEVPLYGIDTARPRGWRAAPLVPAESDALSVRLADLNEPAAEGGRRQVLLGIGLGAGSGAIKVEEKTTAILAQEVRSPFAGTYACKLFVRGEGSSREFYENVFLKNFSCSLQFFQFTDKAKTPDKRTELAAIPFAPAFADGESPRYETFELTKTFINPTPGANFTFGLGMGVAVVVTKTTPGALDLPASELHRALVRISRIQLDFKPKEVNPDVVV